MKNGKTIAIIVIVGVALYLVVSKLFKPSTLATASGATGTIAGQPAATAGGVSGLESGAANAVNSFLNIFRALPLPSSTAPLTLQQIPATLQESMPDSSVSQNSDWLTSSGVALGIDDPSTLAAPSLSPSLDATDYISGLYTPTDLSELAVPTDTYALSFSADSGS